MKPQKHRAMWLKEELKFIEKSIADNKPLEEIRLFISLRTPQAILTKINRLGYGYYTNNDSGKTYFKSNIKHKKRRKKEEMQTRRNNTPIDKEPIDDSIGLGADIIAKFELNMADLDEIIRLHKKIISPHTIIIDKLEAIKNQLWDH